MTLFGKLNDIKNSIKHGTTIKINGKNFIVEGDPWAEFPHDPKAHEAPPIEVLSRADWFAREPRASGRAVPLAQPVPTVQLIHDTESDPCETRDDCLYTVNDIQQLHMEEDGYDDINFNFLIGGDGAVYEGRGWDRQVERNLQWPGDASKSCVVALIGNYLEHPPPESMMKTFELFVHKFVLEKKLEPRCTAIKI